ncbi:hypothetical protein P3T73_14540 [Kiritimatiellota bacterium B12222]|nr:hypothetical protein P3T73_14540 [Kiritimatiellota bacterium B12222]
MNSFFSVFLLLVSLTSVLFADVSVLRFNDAGFAHGTILTTQYQEAYGITFSATGGMGDAVIYNTEISPNGADPDLERVVSSGTSNDSYHEGWDGGNLSELGGASSDYIVGNALMIQSTQNGSKTGDVYDTPNDYSGGGSFKLVFTDTPFDYTATSIVIVDHEGNDDWGFQFIGLDREGESQTYNLNTSSIFADDALTDNNYINRLPIVDAFVAAGIVKLTELNITLSGSGALGEILLASTADELVVLVPEQSSLSYFGMVLMLGVGILVVKRRRLCIAA